MNNNDGHWSLIIDISTGKLPFPESAYLSVFTISTKMWGILNYMKYMCSKNDRICGHNPRISAYASKGGQLRICIRIISIYEKYMETIYLHTAGLWPACTSLTYCDLTLWPSRSSLTYLSSVTSRQPDSVTCSQFFLISVLQTCRLSGWSDLTRHWWVGSIQ